MVLKIFLYPIIGPFSQFSYEHGRQIYKDYQPGAKENLPYESGRLRACCVVPC